MPKNYKTYAKPGSFSEFQIKTPDQTGKIKEQTEKQIRGRERAQRFLEGNRDIYLRAQRLVNAAEESSRDLSFDMQSKERQSFKDALDRDYKIQMDNLDRQTKGKQQELKEVSALSQTAFKLLGGYLKEQEEKKVAAAHDVISRTGLTYEQMVAFQKMNDNLTLAEFAAQDSVRELQGPDGSSQNLDALFTIYQNRNTKRWFESKALFNNTLNAYPDYLEQKILDKQQETGQTITDFDPLLAEAKREFIELHFVGKARPEVLSGLGVYAKLDEINGQRRSKLLTAKRDLQKKELERDGQNAFLSAYAEDNVAGLVRVNGTNPSLEKRNTLVSAIKLAAKGTGAYSMSVEDIDRFLQYPGGGSNGKTFEDSFPGSTAELREVQRDIEKRLDEDQKLEDKKYQREVDNFVIDRVNFHGQDGTYSEADHQQVVRETHAAFPGYTSDFLDRAKQMTPDAAVALESEQLAENLARIGRYDLEAFRNHKFIDSDKRNRWYNIAVNQEKMSKHPDVTNHERLLESKFYSHPTIAAMSAVNPKANEINYILAVADFKNKYKERIAQMSLLKDVDMNQARQNAFDVTLAEMVNEIETTHTKEGMARFNSIVPSGEALEQLQGKLVTGEKQLQEIQRIARDDTISDETAYAQAAAKMNHQQIINAMENYASPNFQMPPAIVIFAEAMNRTPLFVLKKISPHIGDGTTKLQLDKLSGEIEQKYQRYIDTPFTPIRNTFRSAERTGRANVGDQKLGASAPLRPSMFNVVQYVSADPAIRGKDDGPGGRIYYEPRQHGGRHYHNHYEFENRQQAAAAVGLFRANGFRVTSYLRPEDKGSAHSHGVAIDVAPPTTLPYTDEAEAAWSASANAVIGFNPLENE